MSWDVYQDIQNFRKSNDNKATLDYIKGLDTELQNWAPIVVLTSELFEGMGDHQRAADVLAPGCASGDANFWSYYSYARLLFVLKRYNESFEQLRNGHAEIGWRESRERGYTITHDYFSPNIFKWEKYFEGYAERDHLNFLEIGSWQGGSATWLLDKVLVQPNSRLTCIDTWQGSSEHADWVGGLPLSIEELFDQNIEKTGAKQKVTKVKSYSQEALRFMQSESFDFIYVDGAHESKYLIQDAILCWPILKSQGLMLFDDYPFTFASQPEQNSAHAIDFFLSVFRDEIEVLDKDRQVLIKKISP